MADKIEVNDLKSLLEGKVEVNLSTDDVKLPEDKPTVENQVEETTEDNQDQVGEDKNPPSSNPKGVEEKPKEVPDLDKDKNPLDDKGKVEETQEEISNEALEIVQDSITRLQDKLGIEFTDEQLGTIDLKGDIETINAIAELGANVKAEKLVNQFLKSNPEIYDYAMHIKAGGDRDSYFNRQSSIPNLDNITIDKADETSQEKWYRNYLKANGTEEEEIEDLITVAKDRGTLYDKSVKGFDKLKDHYNSLRQEEITKNELVVKEIEEGRVQILKNVKEILDKGKILNLPVAKEEAKEIFDFYTKPIDKEGTTLRQKMWDNLTLEQEMLLDNIIRKGFKGFLPETENKKLTKTLVDLNKQNKERQNRIGGEATKDNFNTSGKLDYEMSDLAELLKRK